MKNILRYLATAVALIAPFLFDQDVFAAQKPVAKIVSVHGKPRINDARICSVRENSFKNNS